MTFYPLRRERKLEEHKPGDKRLKENRTEEYDKTKHHSYGKPQTAKQKFAGEVNMAHLRVRGASSIANLSSIKIPRELMDNIPLEKRIEFDELCRECYTCGRQLRQLADKLQEWNKTKYPPELPTQVEKKQ